MRLPELDINDPNQACLMAGGDCIGEVVGKAARNLQKEAGRYKLAIPVLVNNAAGTTGLHPHFIWWALFRPKQWPPMSKSDKDLLRLAQQVYEAAGAKRPDSLSPFSGNPGWTIPEDEGQIRKAFKMMLSGIQNDIEKPLLRSWAKIVSSSVKEIQKQCEILFGIPCTKDEAEGLFYGDLTRMSLYHRIPGPYPNLIPALLDL